MDQYPLIDVTIDGADEVDETLNCIKGGGACHLREKVLAEAADTFILVADYRKNSDLLGKNVRRSLIYFPSAVSALSPFPLPFNAEGRLDTSPSASIVSLNHMGEPQAIGRGLIQVCEVIVQTG